MRYVVTVAETNSFTRSPSAASWFSPLSVTKSPAWSGS